MHRVIMHVDLDAFFASVEERENPFLKGLPVVIGADPKGGRGRGVVSTCTYPARSFGIRSGMAISQAFKLCPKAVFLPPNFSLYSKASRNVMAVLKGYAERFEQVGIDEAFLEVTQRVGGDFDETERLAREIQSRVMEKERLSCSVGVSFNKSIAKISSDFKKPFGVTVVKPAESKDFLEPLPVRKLWGVGPKTEKVLQSMGIETVGSLSRLSEEFLQERLGSWGQRLRQLSLGIDSDELVEDWESKSIGRETTFQSDLGDKALVLEELAGLAREVVGEARGSGTSFKTITVKVRFQGFETLTHSKSFMVPVCSSELVERFLPSMLAHCLDGKRKRVRLVGFRVSNLSAQPMQKTLF